jgi:histidyl-tRNA synthetase
MEKSKREKLIGSITARNYQGTRDWLGGEAIVRQQVMDTLRQVFIEFGFEPLETPELELYEVLSGKYGAEENELSYKFTKGDSCIGLRYDHTVPLARVAIQHQDEIIFPYKRYAIGPVFRAEKPQRGRYRRFIQCDFDIVGVAEPIADAEVVALTYAALTRIRFKEFEIQISDRRLLNGIAKAVGADTQELILALLRSWDKFEKADRVQISEELKKTGASNGLISRFFEVTDQLLALKKENILEEIRKLFPNQPLVTQGTEVLEKMLDFIDGFGVPLQFYRVNPCLARGLLYYTGPVFETIVKEAGIGAITGGGRFDNLIKALGGPDVPATGSSFGLERIISVMKTLKIAKPKKTATQVFVATFDPDSPALVKKAVRLATRLREAGIATELSMEKGNIGKQLKVPDERGIPIAVFAGPQEAKNEEVIVKNLAIPFGRTDKKDKWSNQWKILEKDVVDKVKELLKSKNPFFKK